MLHYTRMKVNNEYLDVVDADKCNDGFCFEEHLRFVGENLVHNSTLVLPFYKKMEWDIVNDTITHYYGFLPFRRHYVKVILKHGKPFYTYFITTDKINYFVKFTGFLRMVKVGQKLILTPVWYKLIGVGE